MLTDLTQVQLDLIPAYQEKWLKISLGTSDTDVSRVKKLIFLTYSRSNLKTPRIVVSDSPLASIHGFANSLNSGLQIDKKN